MADPKIHAPVHMCYHSEFDRPRSNVYGRVEGAKKFVGFWDPTLVRWNVAYP